MQYIHRFYLKPGKSLAYQEWLAAHEQELAANAPPGWQRLGTWMTVLNFGKFQCETRWEVDDYASLGVPASETFDQLSSQHREFVDITRPSETYLMKSSKDIYIRKDH
jgi:hypothetical protein